MLFCCLLICFVAELDLLWTEYFSGLTRAIRRDRMRIENKSLGLLGPHSVNTQNENSIAEETESPDTDTEHRLGGVESREREKTQRKFKLKPH